MSATAIWLALGDSRLRADLSSDDTRPRCQGFRRHREGDALVNDQLGDIGRFAEPSLFILASLGEGPKHGYAIMTDVEAISGQHLGPGTLYAALARLEKRGLIEALEPEDRRRPYRLTGLGQTTLQTLLEGLSSFARTGLRRLEETR